MLQVNELGFEAFEECRGLKWGLPAIFFLPAEKYSGNSGRLVFGCAPNFGLGENLWQRFQYAVCSEKGTNWSDTFGSTISSILW
jgi:hypothetical protein